MSTPGGYMLLHRTVMRAPVWRDVPHRARWVWLYLATYAHGEGGKLGEAWPKVETTADHLGMSEPTVRRALKDLRQAGLILQYKRGRYWRYKPLWPGPLQQMQGKNVQAGHVPALGRMSVTEPLPLG